MAETQIVFQTIKLGESGKIDYDLPKQYYSIADGISPILLADVKPFRIVGGHISTNIFQEASLLALRLTANKRSLPIMMDFHESIPGFDDSGIWKFETLSYITLSRKMTGYYWWGAGDNMHKVNHELEDVTHLYMLVKDSNSKLKSYHTVSMTLLLERDMVDLGKTIEKREKPLDNARRKPNR